MQCHSQWAAWLLSLVTCKQSHYNLIWINTFLMWSSNIWFHPPCLKFDLVMFCNERISFLCSKITVLSLQINRSTLKCQDTVLYMEWEKDKGILESPRRNQNSGSSAICIVFLWQPCSSWFSDTIPSELRINFTPQAMFIYMLFFLLFLDI